MKHIITLCLLLTLQFTFAQVRVGIKTNNPQQTLHIAGNNSSIRVEGLNASQNEYNNGLKKSKLYVNADGDLVLDTAPATVLNLAGSALVNPAITVTTNNGAVTTKNLTTGTFTTLKNGYVKLSYNIRVEDILQTNGNPLKDGKARIVGLNIYIDGTLVNGASQSYMNYGGNNTGIATGFIDLNGCKYVKLNAGNHTFKMEATIEGNTYGFKANFGGDTGFNHIQIVEF